MPLTRERIIATALTLIDADGVDRLSMRALGKRLGVDPMAVYYHVPNKAALFDGIVEHLWAGVVLPQEPAPSWQSLLHNLFSSFRERLLQHPRAVVLVGTRPSTSVAMLRLVDDTLGRLDDVGLAGRTAMQLLDCLAGFTVGKVLAEIAEPLGGPADTVATAMSGITPDSHPNLVAALASGYTFDPAEEFDRGLRALLTGWTAGP